MQLIFPHPPQAQAEPGPTLPAPQTFTPFDLQCSNAACHAHLRVDSPQDLSYHVRLTQRSGHLTSTLGVTCPACQARCDLESCPPVGDPTLEPEGYLTRAQRAAAAPHFRNFPDEARTRAYQAWERAQPADFWPVFCGTYDFRVWAGGNKTAADTLRQRLLQD